MLSASRRRARDRLRRAPATRSASAAGRKGGRRWPRAHEFVEHVARFRRAAELQQGQSLLETPSVPTASRSWCATAMPISAMSAERDSRSSTCAFFRERSHGPVAFTLEYQRQRWRGALRRARPQLSVLKPGCTMMRHCLPMRESGFSSGKYGSSLLKSLKAA